MRLFSVLLLAGCNPWAPVVPDADPTPTASGASEDPPLAHTVVPPWTIEPLTHDTDPSTDTDPTTDSTEPAPAESPEPWCPAFPALPVTADAGLSHRFRACWDGDAARIVMDIGVHGPGGTTTCLSRSTWEASRVADPGVWIAWETDPATVVGSMVVPGVGCSPWPFMAATALSEPGYSGLDIWLPLFGLPWSGWFAPPEDTYTITITGDHAAGEYDALVWR